MRFPKKLKFTFDFLHKKSSFFLCIIPNLIKSTRTNKKYIDKFENFLKIERNRIDNIIDDFKAGGIRAKIQAPNRLKELTNTIHGKIYEQELKAYIQKQVCAMAV